MLTKADFQRAIRDSIASYPSIAPLYQASDPRIMQHLDAMVIPCWRCFRHRWRWPARKRSRRPATRPCWQMPPCAALCARASPRVCAFGSFQRLHGGFRPHAAGFVGSAVARRDIGRGVRRRRSHVRSQPGALDHDHAHCQRYRAVLRHRGADARGRFVPVRHRRQRRGWCLRVPRPLREYGAGRARFPSRGGRTASGSMSGSASRAWWACSLKTVRKSS